MTGNRDEEDCERGRRVESDGVDASTGDGRSGGIGSALDAA